MARCRHPEVWCIPGGGSFDVSCWKGLHSSESLATNLDLPPHFAQPSDDIAGCITSPTYILYIMACKPSISRGSSFSSQSPWATLDRFVGCPEEHHAPEWMRWTTSSAIFALRTVFFATLFREMASWKVNSEQVSQVVIFKVPNWACFAARSIITDDCMGPICGSKSAIYFQPIIFISIYSKSVGSTSPRTPPSWEMPKDLSIRKRYSLFDAKHLAAESPISARQTILSEDIQTTDSDWDIDVGNTVVQVLGASQKLNGINLQTDLNADFRSSHDWWMPIYDLISTMSSMSYVSLWASIPQIYTPLSLPLIK